MIADRVNKGKKCMVCSFALVSEITLGAFLIMALLSLYKVIFLPVVTFNSCAWDNITKQQMGKLQSVQLKFLKRILRAPASTANCFTFIELGILPIEFNIHISQLNFLHHILSLDDDDPVLQDYNQQKIFEYEGNWYNEVIILRGRYELLETDAEIISMSKEKWKSKVKEQVVNYAISYLNNENSLKSKTSRHPPCTTLKVQEYFEYLSPADARLLFSIRSGTLDIKTLRSYAYDSNDTLCRLCERENETVEHIVNACDEISRPGIISDVDSLIREDVFEVVRRVKTFINLVEEREEGKGDGS